MNFHETICGRRFFDAQLPHLIKALERIADGLTRPKMSLPHGMTVEPNFLHDLYYGEYEPSVFKEQDKKQQVLNHTVSAAETALRGELSLCFHDLDGSHVFKTCYGDICKAVNALRDYARLLEMACEQWDLTGFHRALYEYHAKKMREIAGKFQAGIGYDYDAAMEKCRRKKKRKKKEDDFGEDALVLAFKRTKQPAEQMKEADIDVDDSPWEKDEDEQERDD